MAETKPLSSDERFQQILTEAMKQPGVAALMAVYDAAEAAYALAATPNAAPEITVSSTSAVVQTVRRV